MLGTLVTVWEVYIPVPLGFWQHERMELIIGEQTRVQFNIPHTYLESLKTLGSVQRQCPSHYV